MINIKKIFSLCLLLLVLFSFGCEGSSQSKDHIPTHILIVQPDDGRTPLTNAINEAQNSICLTIYSLNDGTIEAAMKSARERGVTVKVLYNYYSFSELERDYVTKIMSSLETAGILVKRASPEFTVTHQKTFSFDSAKSIIMTFNLESNYFGGTRDFGIITTDSREVLEIAKVFEADWSYSKVSPEVDSLVWSNNNSRTKIVALIQSATHSLEIYNEELEDLECLNAMVAKATSGVTVRVISAQLGGTGMADKNKKYREYLNSNGVQAKYMPTDSYLYCHAKMILVDYGTSNSKAFIGSENFSTTSLDKNRELGILVSEKEILDRLHSTFETDWPHCAFDPR